MQAEELKERVDAALRECVERDRTGVLPRFWRQRLARVDLEAPRAERELAELERAVRAYRAGYPFGFPSTRWGDARLLALRLNAVSSLLARLRQAAGSSHLGLPARVWLRVRAAHRLPRLSADETAPSARSSRLGQARPR
jgi:hypothetical protein